MIGKISKAIRRMFVSVEAKKLEVENVYQKKDGDWLHTHTRNNGKLVGLGAHVAPDFVCVGSKVLPVGRKPEDVLGEGYGDPIVWTHKDDLFVDFQILREIVAGDVSFFMRYLSYEMTQEEKDVYPYFYAPCFAEVREVVNASMQTPLLEISEEQSCFLAFFENVMGLLLVSQSDVDDIKRRSFGFEDVPEKSVYQMTFMRFDPKVVERLDFAGTVIAHYELAKTQRDPLRVNFATYNENE